MTRPVAWRRDESIGDDWQAVGYSTSDRPLARDLTRQWADDSDDQVAVAASAAFHTHLRHDHDEGILQPGEWDAALAAIRREAVKRSFRRWGHQRGAWTEALLLDRLGTLDDLSAGQVPARLNLGDTLGPDRSSTTTTG